MVPLSLATAIAERAHRDQKRADGRPYIEHPLAVIEILMAASTYLPSNIYAAAVLHDVIEDTEITYGDLVRSVGRPIATMVLGLSRPQRMLGEPENAWEQRYLKQMQLVHGIEPGILLIKIADRIHNLETADVLSARRRAALLSCTRDLYLPFFEEARRDQPAALHFAYENLLGQLERWCEPAMLHSSCHSSSPILPPSISCRC